MNLESFNYIDAHSHLNFTHFDHDREAVIAAMKDRGIGAINVGIDAETSRESIELAKNHEHIWASVGCHPTEATLDFAIKQYKDCLPEVGAAAVPNKVVAIGECGLDYSRSEYRSDDQKEIQKTVFVKQIQLAAETDRPLILHIRPQEGSMDAYEQGLDILRHYQHDAETELTGTAHFFVGSREVAEQFLDLGFYISFTGPITYDQRLQDVCSYVPAERLLAETDSPFATPEPRRGERNSPLLVPRIVEQIAACKGVDQEEIQSQIVQNTADLFGVSFS